MGERVGRVRRRVNAYVTDTHTLFWHLTNSPRLGAQAAQAFREASSGAALIYVPVIVLAELYYLNRKQGDVLDFHAVVKRLQRSQAYLLVPFRPGEVLDLDLDRAVPEMHDRIIVGVARRLNAPLLTVDPQIIQSNPVTIVW
jgi:PIN domain nuclease of toxin-antitoxin system